ncbi:MAG: CRTAC1 family protein, partial [Planctomycetota bacterium JB042]
AGDGTFEEIAGAAGVAAPGDGTAALFFDADHDGAVDLLVGHAGYVEKRDRVGGPSRLYRNVSATTGDGGLRFEEVGEAAGFDALHVTYSLAAADADLDGFVDVHVASYNVEGLVAPNSWHEASNGTPNALYFGSAEGRFVDRAAEVGVADSRWSYAAAFCDFDEDGDQDLYVANDFASNALFRNRGDGTFEDVTAALGVTDVGNGMGVTWGDHDGDGDLDLYVANMSAVEATRIFDRVASPDGDPLERTVRDLMGGNTLFTWTGERFEKADVGGDDARWAWSAQFDDLDLDGDQDLVCVNGFLSGPSRRDTRSVYWRHVVQSTLPPRATFVTEEVNSAAYQDRQMGPVFAGTASFAGYERDKVWLWDGGRYLDVSGVSGADDENDGRALVFADFDDDGDRDLFVHHSQLGRHRLYRNDAPDGTGHRSIKVRLRATEGPAEAMGAIVRATIGGRTTAQVLAYGSGFLSQNAPELVFGAGGASTASEVTVRWPGRAVESFGPLEAGRTHLLEEGRGQPTELPRQPIDLGEPPPR